MCCKEKAQEGQCNLAAHKEKIVPCAVALVSIAVVAIGLMTVFHCHKEDCNSEAE